jgi:hypothetical protein
MFAKIAKFRAISPHRARPSRLAHANDNRTDLGAVRARHHTRRPRLTCHWRPFAGGGLECHWSVENADGAAPEQPDRHWMIAGLSLFGIETASGWRAASAAG